MSKFTIIGDDILYDGDVFAKITTPEGTFRDNATFDLCNRRGGLYDRGVEDGYNSGYDEGYADSDGDG